MQVYSYAERPKGKTRSQINIAVDALCRLSVGESSLRLFPHSIAVEVRNYRCREICFPAAKPLLLLLALAKEDW